MNAPDPRGQALLGRARLEVADGERAAVRLVLDGWPLVSVDLAAGQVAVNDLRQLAMYGHAAAVGTLGPDDELCLGAVVDELYLLVGEAACVFVTPEAAPGSHAEVAVVDSSSGQLLLERTVRYRQVPRRAVSTARPGLAR
jgi:hypothetical protein